MKIKIRKNFIINPAAFFACLGIGLVGLGVIFYVQDIYNATSDQIGLLAALWSLFYVVGCLGMRPFFHRFRPSYILAASSFCVSILVFMIHFAGSLKGIYVIYSLIGLSLSFFWPPMMAWVASGLEGSTLNRVISRYNFSWSVGIIIGPVLAGWLSQKTPELPLLFGGCSLFVCFLIIIAGYLFVPQMREPVKEEEQRGADASGRSGDTLLRYPAWVGVFTAFVVLGVIANIFPVSARNDLFLSKSTIGFILFLRSLFNTLGFLLMGRLVFWHFKGWPLILGQALTACVLLLLMKTSAVIPMALFIILLGVLTSFNFSNSFFHGVSGSSRRASRLAIHEAVLAFGMISGSYLGGIIYKSSSMSLVYFLCIAIVLAGMVVQTGLCLWVKNRQ
jgi:predicted MFS family arabinose efflux permease